MQVRAKVGAAAADAARAAAAAPPAAEVQRQLAHMRASMDEGRSVEVGAIACSGAGCCGVNQ